MDASICLLGWRGLIRIPADNLYPSPRPLTHRPAGASTPPGRERPSCPWQPGRRNRAALASPAAGSMDRAGRQLGVPESIYGALVDADGSWCTDWCKSAIAIVMTQWRLSPAGMTPPVRSIGHLDGTGSDPAIGARGQVAVRLSLRTCCLRSARTDKERAGPVNQTGPALGRSTIP